MYYKNSTYVVYKKYKGISVKIAYCGSNISSILTVQKRIIELLKEEIQCLARFRSMIVG